MRRLLTIMFLLAALTARAQEDLLEYRWDVGGGPALAFPITDGTGFMQSVGFGVAGVARRAFNPRMALRMNLSFLRMSGDTHSTYFPSDAMSGTADGGKYAVRRWNRNVVDVAAVGELNFWGYGSGPRYKGNKVITPYILLGLGFTMALAPAKTDLALNIPVGAGVKYKIGKRLNLGFEWRFSFTTTDRLEADTKKGLQLSDPYGVKSKMLKNKDSYSTMTISLTYDISPKYRKCNN